MAPPLARAASLQKPNSRNSNSQNFRPARLSLRPQECLSLKYIGSLLSHFRFTRSLYLVHEDVKEDSKEKAFELEMSWIGDESGGIHLPVPKELQIEAEQKAKALMEANFD